MFELLGHPKRLRVFEYVLDSRSEYATPTLIAEELEFDRGTTSAVLRRMVEAGLLVCKPSGRYRFYEVNDKMLDEMKEFLT